MKYESLIIGHVTGDHNVDYEGKEVFAEGGAALYSSASAYGIGHNVAALTSVSKEDKDRLKAFRLPEKDVFCVFKDSSTDMYNRYFTADRERRESRCPRRGGVITVADVISTGAESEVYHLAGLLYGDYEDGIIEALSKLGKVAVDVQGYLRHRAANGEMYFEDWQDKKKLLPYIDFLKTDAAEAEILTGTSDRREAAKILYSWGAKEVLITHNTEVLAYDGKGIYTCPIKARNLSGRTGRGDTAFAAYITERKNKSAKDALLFATATVSLKMEKPGAFDGTREDVDKYIDEFYS